MPSNATLWRNIKKRRQVNEQAPQAPLIPDARNDCHSCSFSVSRKKVMKTFYYKTVANVTGYLLHLAKNIFRKVADLCHKERYQSGSEFNTWLNALQHSHCSP